MRINVTTLSHNEAMRHNLLGQVRLEPGSKLQSPTVSSGAPTHEPRLSTGRTAARTSIERPRSMVSLGRPLDISRDNMNHELMDYQSNNDNSISHNKHYPSALDTTNKENQFIMDQHQRRSRLQCQTLYRYTPATSQLVNLDRMPKIPFQYTTSCYGGEAVLYYPSNAHLSHHQPIRHHQGEQHQQSMFHQQQHAPQPSAPTAQLRMCNRIQSLDRRDQLHQQQQQQPQRSHVMMLRDYYLSLQEQSQKQQQYQEFLKRQQQQQQQQQQSKQQMLDDGGAHQKQAATNSITMGNHIQAIHQQHQQYRQSQLMMQPPVESRRVLCRERAQQQQQQQQRSSVTTNLNVMQADDATKAIRNNDHELMREQPASAAVAYHRIQPRMARIRSNQFNGLYVKRADSPVRSHEINNGGLIVLDHRHQTVSSAGGGGAVVKPIASSGGAGPNLMAISQSSLSQQSSKMSSSSSMAEHSSDEEVCSSDECSANEWMESTMV